MKPILSPLTIAVLGLLVAAAPEARSEKSKAAAPPAPEATAPVVPAEADKARDSGPGAPAPAPAPKPEAPAADAKDKPKAADKPAFPGADLSPTTPAEMKTPEPGAPTPGKMPAEGAPAAPKPEGGDAKKAPAMPPASGEGSASTGTVPAKPEEEKKAPPAPVPAPELPVLTAEQETAFSLALFKTLAQGTKSAKTLENVVVSPGSAARLLRALQAGANGETGKQIVKVLGVDPAKTSNAPVEPTPEVLKTASAVWTHDGLTLLPEYEAAVKSGLGAQAAVVPLKKEPETARKTINGWVEEHTGGNIKELLKAPDMKGAEMVLTDAVWFKDSWARAFKPTSTLTSTFALPSGKEQATRFVSDKRRALHGKTETAEVLALPFATERYQFICLLPVVKKKSDPAQALQAFEKTFGPKALAAAVDSLEMKEVDIRLPKVDFKEVNTDMAGLLKKMGMTTAFSDSADFSRMAKGGEDLKVGVFKQSASFKLDEEGAEASAATAVVIITKSAGPRQTPPPVPFHADRPCLFLVRDTVTGAVPFIVRCAVPAKAELPAKP